MLRRGFTLLEVLVTIAILAALITGGVFTYISVTAWARETSDRQTLIVLNDALQRYKSQGGGATALTAGTNIRTLLGKLQTGVTWAGKHHEFLQAGFTYPARSLSATGTRAQYTFYRANSYTDTDLAPQGGGGPSYPYGEGVGYAVNDGSSNYNISMQTTTGYFAVRAGNAGPIEIFAAMDGDTTPDATISGSAANITFWSCAAEDDSTPSGYILGVRADNSDFSNQLTVLDVTGLTNITSLSCSYNLLTTLPLSGLTNLAILNCSYNQLTNLDFSGITNLTSLSCDGNQLASLSISSLTSLSNISCGNNPLTTMSISNITSLITFRCSGGQLTGLSLSNLPNLSGIFCDYNQLTSLSLSNLPSLTSLRCNNNQLTGLPLSVLGNLTYLDCKNNQLNASALNAIFTALQSVYGYSIWVSQNPGFGTSNTSIATGKGWAVY